MEIHNSIMDLHKWITNLHNCIMYALGDAPHGDIFYHWQHRLFKVTKYPHDYN